MNLKLFNLIEIIFIIIIDLTKINCYVNNLTEYPSSSFYSSSNSSSFSSVSSFLNNYDFDDTNQNLKLLKLNNSSSGSSESSNNNKQSKLVECKTDSNCIDSHSVCLNGNCIRVCSNQIQHTNNLDLNHHIKANKCVYFHCDSKQLIVSSLFQKQNISPGSNVLLNENYLENFSIETNNYPLLDRYLSKKKCSWILKNLNHITETTNNTDSNFNNQQQEQRPESNSFIQLRFERFSTQLVNDFLYIFAGDSIYSPLIAALSGNQASSNEPSLAADDENENFDQKEINNDDLLTDSEKTTNSINLTFFNVTSLYLLFKTDVLSPYSSLNSFKSSFISDDNKPSGISIKYKFSSPCVKNPDTNATNENELNPTNVCFDNFIDQKSIKKNECKFNNSTNCTTKAKLVETINYQEDENSIYENDLLNSSLRRAFHCSFEHKNFLYVVGGYSFSKALSFVSRLNLIDLKWEHYLDRKSSSIINRSNRKYFSNSNFRHLKLELPQNRYAHSCMLDPDSDHFYMYGGIKYDSEIQYSNRITTNELWSYNLQTNKWTLINQQDVRSRSIYGLRESKNYVLPVAVSGHSMHLHKKSLNSTSIFIFFGYSEYYGSTLTIIQEYNLESKTWSLHNTYNINIGYGHSTIYDKLTNNIYFYGGLISNSDISKTLYFSFDMNDNFGKHSSNNRYLQPPLMSSNLYWFNLYYYEWSKSDKIIEPSYMHSVVLHRNKLYFYGGICIDENKKHSQNKLYTSNQLQAYDLVTHEWIQTFRLKGLDDKPEINSSIKLNQRQRYAHSSLIYNNSIYIFGGFNGFFLNDLFKINLNSITDGSNMNYRKKRQENADSYKVKKSTDTDEDSFGNKITSKNKDFDYLASAKEQPIQIDYTQVHETRYLNLIESCNRYTSCHMCQLDSNCVWNNKKCEYYSPIDMSISANSNQNQSNLTNQTTNFRQLYKKPSCSQMCSEYKSCLNCTLLSNINGQYQSECVWCASQSKCVLKKALHILFPFGECFNLISDRQQCERTLSNVPQFYSPQFSSSSLNLCSILHSNCSSCIRDERCGWCTKDLGDFDSLNTGYGSCMEGGETGSLSDKCKLNWFFSKCPLCECNGHSTCSNSTSLSCGKCLNNTEGEYCSECKKGFFGNAKNNGVCQPCDCGQQASECDTNNGRCYCNTKGVVGTKCDQCDSPRYSGRPNMTDGSCFYNLTTDYQFTFNLNKESDRYYSRINFVNHPIRGSDDDIDFMVRCFRENALINITYVSNYNFYDYDNGIIQVDPDSPSLSTYNEMQWPFDLLDNLTLLWNNINENRSYLTTTTTTTSNLISTYQPKLAPMFDNGYNYYFGPISAQTVLLAQINCTSSEFKYTFSNRDLNYADKNRNLVFIVNVYDFQTPITIQIAFSRKSKIQLLHFFITFFGCLLSLLTIAFITWKTKQRFDRYRRQRQIVIQMEHMASRPFTRLFVDITDNDKSKIVENEFKTDGLFNDGIIKIEKGETSKENDQKTKKSPRKSKNKENKKSKFYINNGALDSEIDLVKQGDKKEAEQKFKIMPIAVEPLNNNKSAIVTCLLKLPQGGLNTTPKGSSPFMLCSTFVQINSSSPLISNTLINETEGFDDDQTDNNNQSTKQVDT